MLVGALITIMSFLILLQPYEILTNVSAVESVGVGVYWNSECTEAMTLIDWGGLYPSSSRSIEIFIRNENTAPIHFLFARTENWNPPEASNNMHLYLRHSEEPIRPNEVTQATLVLHVSEKIAGVEYFEFNIVIFASQYLPGDVDHDGDIDPSDFAFFVYSYGSTPNDPEWNPNADFDFSEKVDVADFVLLAMNHGKATAEHP